MSSSINPVGSVSNSVIVDFKTFLNLRANDAIIEQKTIKHLFDNGTNKASNVAYVMGYPENPIRIRAGSYAINSIGGGKTVHLDKIVSFGEGLYPVQVYVSTNNINVYASSETLTSKSFNLKAYNFSSTTRNVLIYWWAICVDKTTI